ncbi:MAG: RagB/SusD family nutrient uptake outer membrane protein [Bacteroidales bacterium]|jgi:hypothetical protein|nr:RagB/SusD family nutrient uptake outer membrane protein [Bacteroidales bacterium]
MKKNRISALLFAGLALFASCDKLLEFEPQNNVSDEGIIVDQISAQKALNGAYSATADGVASSYVSWNIAADNMVPFTAQSTIIAFLPIVGSADRTSGFGYNGNYRAINRVNNVIANVNELPDNKFTADGKNVILAQAYTLRALSYINLTVTFGAVPIVTKPSNATNQNGILQSPREQVFAQALNDLNQAETLFGSNATLADRGRISVWAVYALKARLYLYTNQWDLAEQYATKVIENTAFQLTATPEGYFLTQKSSESIFEFPFSTSDKIPLYTYYLPSANGGLQDYVVTPALADSLNDPSIGGNRSQLIFNRPAPNTLPYFVREFTKTDGSSSLQVFRLAEQYLIRAEARLKKSTADIAGATADINVIRNRASVAPLASSLSADDLKLALEKERRYELAFEGHRYFDIIRTGRAPLVFGQWEARYENPIYWVFPFPISVLTNDPDLTQNAGY